MAITMNKMRRTLIFTGIILSFLVFNNDLLLAQLDCAIESDIPLPVCYGNSIQLFVTDSADHYLYSWIPGEEQTSSIRVSVTDSIDYQVMVTDTLTGESCLSAPFTVYYHPLVSIQFEQLQLTCSNGDNENGETAMVRAKASGQTAPYTYSWDISPLHIAPDDPALAIGLKAHLWYFIEVEDEYGCKTTDSIFTRAYPNPVIEIIADPDTAYIQNPYVKLAFENLSADSVEVISHFWEFGDNSPRSELETPVHTYTEIDDYTVLLTVYNSQGCDTVYFHDIKVLPIKLNIPNILTPNGDNINDVLVITPAAGESNDSELTNRSVAFDEGVKPLSAYYTRTSLVVFNRQGRKVYESSDYNNDWGAEGLKDGVYFYILHCEGFKSNEVYRGSITIMGSQNY